MTQEEKISLSKDLFGRVMCGVKVKYGDKTYTLGYNLYLKEAPLAFESYPMKFYLEKVDKIKPYLRPMSSMTEEELYEVQEILGKGVEIHNVFISIVDSSINSFSYLELLALFDWLNAHHFDYRGLIEKGLALEAPENMY